MKPYLEPILHQLRVWKVFKYIPKGGKVCDICCGREGRLLFKIENFIDEGIGYDKDIYDIKKGKIMLKKADLKKQIFESSNYFDCIILLAALEHLDHPKDMVAECLRILKPGGRLLITTPSSSAKWLLEFLSLKLGFVSAKQVKDHKYYFNPVSLKRLLLKAGFQEDKIMVEAFEFGCNLFAYALK